MKPTYDNLFIAEMKKDTTTASGIVLSRDIETGNKPAVVLAAGPDAKGVKAGMKCYVKWSDAVPVTHEGQIGAFISEKSVLAYFD